MSKLYLPFYGVPEDYEEKFLSFMKEPEIESLYKEIKDSQLSPTDLVEKYYKNPTFSFAIARAAIDNNAALVIPIIYSIQDQQKEYVHFEWKIPHPVYELTFSNAFFVVYFNDLYRDIPDLVGRNLAIKGVILRALASLSYTPWTNFLLPIGKECVENFLYLPLYDRDSEFLMQQGDEPS